MRFLRNLDFFVKISHFRPKKKGLKMGVFRENRDFFDLKTQLGADTIPPIYIVFKMPPKMAPHVPQLAPRPTPRFQRVFFANFLMFFFC